MRNLIKIKNSNKYGRGIYATRNIQRGEVVEVSPVIVLDKVDALHLGGSILDLYDYAWTAQTSALALGVGSLFNHSEKPNVEWKEEIDDRILVFIASKFIKKEGQLFVDYGYDPKVEAKKLEKYKFKVMTDMWKAATIDPKAKTKSVL